MTASLPVDIHTFFPPLRPLPPAKPAPHLLPDPATLGALNPTSSYYNLFSNSHSPNLPTAKNLSWETGRNNTSSQVHQPLSGPRAASRVLKPKGQLCFHFRERIFSGTTETTSVCLSPKTSTSGLEHVWKFRTHPITKLTCKRRLLFLIRPEDSRCNSSMAI